MKALHCKNIVDLLVDYVDGEMDPAQARRLEEHLGACAPCEEFLDAYRRTGTICKEALKTEMPAAFKSSLFEFLRRELQSPKY